MKKLVCIACVLINIISANTLDMMLQLNELSVQSQEIHRQGEENRKRYQANILRDVANIVYMVENSKTQEQQRLGIKLLRNATWNLTEWGGSDEIYNTYRKNGKHRIFIVEARNTIEINKFPKIKEKLSAIRQIAQHYASSDYTETGASTVLEEVISFLKEYDELAKQNNK
ncbi:hypothetical protein [Helicobacter sp. T3_23-1059]